MHACPACNLNNNIIIIASIITLIMHDELYMGKIIIKQCSVYNNSEILLVIRHLYYKSAIISQRFVSPKTAAGCMSFCLFVFLWSRVQIIA